MPNDTYNSPFNARYASKEMQYIYSPDFKFKTWRKLWIALAEAERNSDLILPKSRLMNLKQMQIISIMMLQKSMKRSFATM